MSADFQRRAIDAAAAAIRDNAGLLTELDSAIGDGDHGANMSRGFDAVAARAGELGDLAAGPALQRLGMTLVTNVGGASGPLYGSLFMAMGKALADRPPDADALVAALGEGIAAVQKRGKAEGGEKTLLDVLIPVHSALQAGLDAGERAPGALAARARAAARQGLAATRDLQATKGRAAYLGARSVGHLDPGAQSSCLLVVTLADLCTEEA
jgi:dihydroxyacetone kinase-like protein